MKAREEIRALTGLRGIAALWIVIYHFHHRQLDSATWPSQILERGYLAVDIFFVLSGFVLALSYAHFFANGFTLRNYATFMLRRLARVYPLYVTVVASVIALNFTPFDHLRLRIQPDAVDYVANILMVQTWGIAPSIVGPSWSLSVELIAYILFPPLVWLVLRGRLRYSFATVAVGYALLGLAIQYGPGGSGDTIGSLDLTSPYSGLPVLRCIVEFCGGIFAFRLSTMSRLKAFLSSSLTGFSAIAVAVALMALPRTDFAIALTFPLTVAALAVGRGGVSAVLSTSLPFFFGEISYSVYLIHGPCARITSAGYRLLEPFLPPPIGGILLMPLTYTTVFLVAAWTYRNIEVKARRSIQGLSSRRARLAVETSEAAGQADIAH